MEVDTVPSWPFSISQHLLAYLLGSREGVEAPQTPKGLSCMWH